MLHPDALATIRQLEVAPEHVPRVLIARPCIAATATTQASGLPPKVEPWSPGTNTPTAAFEPTTADTGVALKVP